jgi:hypothetical protein
MYTYILLDVHVYIHTARRVCILTYSLTSSKFIILQAVNIRPVAPTTTPSPAPSPQPTPSPPLTPQPSPKPTSSPAPTPAPATPQPTPSRSPADTPPPAETLSPTPILTPASPAATPVSLKPVVITASGVLLSSGYQGYVSVILSTEELSAVYINYTIDGALPTCSPAAPAPPVSFILTSEAQVVCVCVCVCMCSDKFCSAVISKMVDRV